MRERAPTLKVMYRVARSGFRECDTLVRRPGAAGALVHARARPFPLGGAVTATQCTSHAKGPRLMKSGIHPEYNVTTVTCSCGNSFTTRSTAKNGQIHAESCNECHPFYT